MSDWRLAGACVAAGDIPRVPDDNPVSAGVTGRSNQKVAS